MTRRSGVMAAVGIAAALTLAGCASIPGETMPQKANLEGGGGVAAGVAQPVRNATPLSIVRGFVNNSGDPTNAHDAARVYLASAAQKTWNRGTASSTVDIIDSTFSTEGPYTDANSATVVLQTHLVGTVDEDGSFQPADPNQAADFEITMHLHTESGGQWRILDPPQALLMARSDFDHYYRPVDVYFFNQTWDVLVPDQRYVVADPPSGVVPRIVQLLLDGPSTSLKDAVQDAIPLDASLKTNVEEQENGQITINLTSMQDQPSNARQLMVAQIVRSLANFGSSVAVESEAQPLVSGHLSWRQNDLPNYNVYIGPKATGMVVANSRVLNLNDGTPIRGPAGDGTYNVVTAAESADATELATVTTDPAGGQVLRIGGINQAETAVKGLTANQFTRPTWTPSDAAGDPSRALWTVADGTVLRVANTPQNSWVASPVDTSALTPYGQITDLRLSRDGVRVAVVAGGNLLVGEVVVDQGSVSIKQVRLLQPLLNKVTKVDWLTQDQLVIATTEQGAAVQTVTVDGLKADAYTQANLSSAVTDVAASDGPPVLAVDAAGLWESSDINEAWQPPQHPQPAKAIPFYPG
jgi:lipoprotein LpqB-like beta-propeller protein/sporulation and spore germination protein